ncbi:MAG: MotA/TolQ/ExbB proton channel family protein [Bdellovibrionota bacterium]
MNFSSMLGVMLGVGVMYQALSGTTSNMAVFLDPHGILIVCGGTAAAASISYKVTDILKLFRVFIKRVMGQQQSDYQYVVHELMELNKKASIGVTALNDVVGSIKHDFLREAVQLVATGILNENELRMALETRIKTSEAKFMHEANMFKTIGRYPPAFGLLATTLGMIALLQKIGQPDSQKLIGPAMSIGLIGTLYGIALANMIFIPIGENLTARCHDEMSLMRLIAEGTIMLKAGVNPIAMRESLNSFLSPKDRVSRKAA